MKRYLYTLLIVFGFLWSPSPTLAIETNTATTIVIPIQGMIGRGLLYVIRRGVNEALDTNAKAIIFDMDTPGGRVDVTEEIIRTMIDLPDTIDTYTFINKDALSAGSMIAIATKHIYMAPGSRIGASAIVTATGDMEEGDLKEKHVSSLVALVRSASERNGHDPKLIESMIRRDMEYTLDGDMICKEGQLLTLTDQDAARIVNRESGASPLLSEGTADTLASLLHQVGLDNTTIRRIEITTPERIARFIEVFSFLFLAGGLLGIYIEFKTPGFGVPGITGIVLLAIFFWGHNIAGLAGGIEVILFIIGTVLLALEILVIPGFGIAGLSGLSFMLLAIFMAMVEHYPGTDWFKPPVIQLDGAATTLGLAIAVSLALGLIVAHILSKTAAYHQLILTTALDHEHGVFASAPTDSLLGTKGIAATPLHPSGFGTFNGKRLNVVAHGAFIDTGVPIVVAETHGNRIVVDVDRTSQSTDKTENTENTGTSA